MRRHSKASKYNGYNRSLYRNKQQGMLAGVCAGLADYYSVPAWVVRLFAISALIFTQQLAVIAYVAAIFLIAKRPESSYDDEADTGRHGPRTHESAGKRLAKIKQRVADLASKVEAMESYVTTRKYEYNREINKL